MLEISEDLEQLSQDELLVYLGNNKSLFNLTFYDITDEMNERFNHSYSEGYWRRRYHSLASDILEEVSADENKDDALMALKLERYKLADERTQANAYYRRLSREQTIKEIAIEVADKISSKKILPQFDIAHRANDSKEAILCISDWHYGMDFTNYWNNYNPDIARERIVKLQDMVTKTIVDEGVSRLHIVNLGDMIAGRIHLTIRLESRIDVITQTIEVSEILAEFVHALSQYAKIDYYDCADNHSRLEPNKKEALNLETLQRIIPWYLQTRLSNQNDITIHTNNRYGEDIINFNIFDYKIAGVHGDKDRPIDVVNNINLLTKEHFDMILTAHLHHFSADEKDDTLIISNGSLMGTDTYSKNLRLYSRPSQNLIIATPNNCFYSLERMVLD